ncbi:hypothetical protein BDR05DRAFT_992138 [Suillus weaverae]|nr:hypothetical protein BDR05DRAFT_992138 [Suillus weaverae]
MGDIVILPLDASPALSVETRVSYELVRILGNGEVVGKFETSWNELLSCGDEHFDISFPSILGVHSSLALKAAVLHDCDNQDSTLFDFVLDQCPVGHPDRAAILTKLTWARLKGYIQKDLEDIDSITSLFREALALRPQGHPDHPLSIYHLAEALTWHHIKEDTAVYIHESLQLYCKLLPLCPEGTYLRLNAAGANGVHHVIRECNNLPTDASDEGIHLRRVVLELSVSLCSEGHSERDTYLNNLALSLLYRFNYQGNSDDLNEAISLYEEALRLRPVGHKYHDSSLNNLGTALITRFNQHYDVNDVMRVISLQHEALTLCPPGNPYRDYTLNNLASAVKARYEKLDTSEDLNEAIDLFRDSLQLRPHGHPLRHTSLFNLSSALCSRFTQTQENEDVEEAIRLCQESLEALPSLDPGRCFSYIHLQEAYLSRYKTFAAESHSHASALEAYTTFFELLDRHLATRSSIVARREATSAFRRARTLPVDAASCAMRLDNLRHAIELVEQGRGQQWSLTSRLRSPLEDLEATNKIPILPTSSRSSAKTQYRKLQEQWEAAVAEIRNIQGFSRFLLPPSYEDLQAAARHGPVIILIASQYSCSAIVVPMSGEPHHVRFPRITLTHLEMLKKDFAREIRLASFMHPEETRKEFQVLLRTVGTFWETKGDKEYVLYTSSTILDVPLPDISHIHWLLFYELIATVPPFWEEDFLVNQEIIVTKTWLYNSNRQAQTARCINNYNYQTLI